LQAALEDLHPVVRQNAAGALVGAPGGQLKVPIFWEKM
jgi:hypothetical protein